MRTNDPVVVIGAGLGGLSAALTLAAQGVPVTVLERRESPGGKMREVEIAGRRLDAGPTVLTMRWVFEELFGLASTSLTSHVNLSALETLARHAWEDGARLDLYADVARSTDAVAQMAGPDEARGYRQFARHAENTFATLQHSFMQAPRPSPVGLAFKAGPWALSQTRPFATLWAVLRRFFQDPRLRQLFGRYATYCGSSPFQAPATLSCIAHAEQLGVWSIEGGLQRLAEALATVAADLGVEFHYRCAADRIDVGPSGLRGVTSRDGRRFDATRVIFNGDVADLAAGGLGETVKAAGTTIRPRHRSLSAVTWHTVAETDGFPLHRHNVFFSSDYRREFEEIFGAGRLPTQPTVYVCAQDRDDDASLTLAGRERLMLLVNAPATSDTKPLTASEIARCHDATLERLSRLGLTIRSPEEDWKTTSPSDFARLFPGGGGALYGRASHGWRASFQRSGARTRIPGLYLAGGSVHPGAGIPMAALSGRLAASALLTDLDSTARSRPAGMPGGMSTP